MYRPPKQEARARVAADTLVSFAPMEDLGINTKIMMPRQARPLDMVAGSYTYFAEGDVLVAKITPCFENGKLGVARGLRHGIGFGSSEFHVLRPGPMVDSEFLYYFLLRDSFREEGKTQMGGAVGQQRVPREFIESYSIPLPSLPEQHRIVALLDEAFAGIAKARENTERNLENAREVFESYLNAVFEKRGAGWQVRRVGEIAEHVLGKMLDKNKNKGEPRPYLRNINVRWFDIDLSDLLKMRFLPTETDRYTAVNGDVLVCEGGYPGRAAIWRGEEAIYFQKALHRVRFSKPGLNEWFVYYLYAQDRAGELRDHFSGTGIQHFTGEVLHRFPVPIPPDGELGGLLTSIKRLQAETQRLTALYHRKLAALDALKQSLLYQAFHGDL